MKKLLLILLCSLPLAAMEESALKIKAASLQVPGRLGKISVLHDEEGFRVKQDGILYEVNSGNVDKELRHISNAKLKTLLTKGYLAVNQSNNGDFSLKAHTRVKGGGLICGWWAYALTKGTIYSSLGIAAGAAIGAAVAATGGAAGVGAATAGAGAGKIVGMGTSYLAGLNTGASIGTTAIAGGVVKAVGATNVGLVVGGVASGAGTATGIVAAIEGVSLFVGAIFAGPWCP